MSGPRIIPPTRRRAASDLRHGHVSKATHETYKIHMKRFLLWLGKTLTQMESLSAKEIDALVKGYVGHLYEIKASYAAASQTVSAVRHFVTAFKSSVNPESAAALRSFRKRVPKTSRLPMPWTMAVAVAFRMERAQAGMGVAVLVAYAGLLRANEVLDLKREKVFTSDLARSLNVTDTRVKLGLDHTKTGKDQLATLQFPQVESVLQTWCKNKKFRMDEKVFPFTYTDLATAFRKASNIEWPGLNFTLHSLRHGCAVHLLQCGLSRDYVKFAGRWMSDSTVEVYSQANTFFTIANGISKSRREEVKKLADSLPASFFP